MSENGLHARLNSNGIASRASAVASRPREHAAIPQASQRQHQQPYPPHTRPLGGEPLSEQDVLARWILDAQGDQTPQRILQLLTSANYARNWYDARAAGEALRAAALERLYSQRRTPGGPHPDPREPAAFSHTAILTTAVHLTGMNIWQAPEHIANAADLAAKHTSTTRPQLAWVITYQANDAGLPTPTELAVRHTPRHYEQSHQMACLIGYYLRERARLMDPDAPKGIILLPQDPALVSILHQFATGLLALEAHCPDGWPCYCNDLRTRYNRPPDDHQQPTDVLDTTHLRRELEAQRLASYQPQPQTTQTGDEDKAEPCTQWTDGGSNGGSGRQHRRTG